MRASSQHHQVTRAAFSFLLSCEARGPAGAPRRQCVASSVAGGAGGWNHVASPRPSVCLCKRRGWSYSRQRAGPGSSREGDRQVHSRWLGCRGLEGAWQRHGGPVSAHLQVLPEQIWRSLPEVATWEVLCAPGPSVWCLIWGGRANPQPGTGNPMAGRQPAPVQGRRASYSGVVGQRPAPGTAPAQGSRRGLIVWSWFDLKYPWTLHRPPDPGGASLLQGPVWEGEEAVMGPGPRCGPAG